jgi:hypothetical protein
MARKSKRGQASSAHSRPERTAGLSQPANLAALAHHPGFWLSIYFEGLCVFVPSEVDRAMSVLMVNACDAASGGGCQGHGGCPPHLAFLQVCKADICASDDDYDDYVDDWDLILPRGYPIDCGPSAVRLLRWEDIALTYHSQSKQHDLHIVNDTRAPGAKEPDGNDCGSDDFSWVAELDKASPGSGDVDPHCFDPDPPRELVIARMRLETGTLAVSDVINLDDTTNVIWEFKANASGAPSHYSQALASQIVLKIWIPDPTVTLRLKSFRANDEESCLTLRPKGRPNAVNVLIGNLPLTDIIEVPLEDFPDSSTEAHFPALYKISQNPPADPPVPRAISHPRVYSRLGGVRAGTTICPGAQANASDRA